MDRMTYKNHFDLDKDVKAFLDASSREMDLFFENVRNKFKNIDQEDLWDKPTSSALWFAGLEKHGKAFATREAELRETYPPRS